MFEPETEEIDVEYDCGMMTASYSLEDLSEHVESLKAEESSCKHRWPSFAFTVPGKAKERKDGKHADIDKDNTTNNTDLSRMCKFVDTIEE